MQAFRGLQKHWLPGGVHAFPGNHDAREAPIAALRPPVAFDLSSGGPAEFVMEPAQFDLHVWSAGDGFVTHGVFVEDFDGPYPFLG